MSHDLRLLVWQWGRRGAGPRFALELARALDAVPQTRAFLSLSRQAELLQGHAAPNCDLPFDTYVGWAGFARRLATLVFDLPALIRDIRTLSPDLAICAMPGPIDLVMAWALRRLGIPFVVLVHDADVHPGDGLPLQMTLQRALVERACAVVALSSHVADRLRVQGMEQARALLTASHPPFTFGSPPAEPRTHGGPLRLLFFGRLLPYKGLDLFADALCLLGPDAGPDIGPDIGVEVRVAGLGPESDTLARLRSIPGVTVENRWIAETEIPALLAWSDALVLAHREASQSGVAAIAIAARRWLVATDVGGLGEQLQHHSMARLCAPTAEGLAAAIRSLITDPPDDEGDQIDPQAAWATMATRLVADLRAVAGL